MLPVSLGGLLFTLFVFVYYKRIVFLFCFSSSCVSYVASFSGLFFFVLCILKFYQLLTGEERMIPFFFDDFHFCRSRVIGLDMTQNMIFTLCCMVT